MINNSNSNVVCKNQQLVGSAIANLISIFNITESELARSISIPRATINKICSGKILNPSYSTLVLIADYFGVTIDQLVGRMPLYNNKPVKLVQLPVLSMSSLPICGGSVQYEKLNFLAQDFTTIEYDPIKQPKGDSMFAISIDNDAMMPLFDTNTIIVVDTAVKPNNRSYVLAYIASSGKSFLRQLLIEGDMKILKSLNPDFPNLMMNNEDYIIGSVIQTSQKF